MTAPCPYCNSTEPCNEERKRNVSYSDLFGPSIEDVIVCLLLLLPYKLCETLGILHKPGMKGIPCDKEDKGNDMNNWLSNEIKELSLQLSILGYDLNEPGKCLPTPSMFQSRKFVLNRLAEIMEKKDELERRAGFGESESSFSSTGDSLCS